MNSTALKFDSSRLRFRGIIGTGGIGSGKFFVLNGEHTLGREESRSGHFLERNDYCKQHIILHYIKVLMGESFPVMPVGKLGDDDTGLALYKEMAATGLIMDRIELVPHASTLFSFCFYYPDGTGGNLTTDNSASSLVDRELIEKATPDIQNLGANGIIMAAPEVPLEARKVMLELGKHHGLFCAASFTSEEIILSSVEGMFSKIDYLAINMDEAAALAGVGTNYNNENAIKLVVRKLLNQNQEMMITITAGRDGSWCWDGSRLNHFPAISTKVVSTAGAGDAFFSGVLTGISLGLHIFESQQLGSLVAGLALTSPHTIHKGICRNSLYDFFNLSGSKVSESVIKLLEE